MRLDTNAMAFEPDPDRAFVKVMPLYSDTRERVALERWEGGAEVVFDAGNGLEVLVLKGGF